MWKSAYQTDPWDVPLEAKVDLLLNANAEALKVPKVKFVNSILFFVKQDRNYANTDGSVITQTLVRSWPLFTATAVADDFSDFQNRQAAEAAPMGRGWEYVLQQDLAGNAHKWAEEAAQKLTAKPVDVGRYDLVLDPRTSGSRSMSPSATPRNSTARSATRPTTPARASSRRRRTSSASSGTARTS